MKNIFLVLCFMTSLLAAGSLLAKQCEYTDCAKGDVKCEKLKKKGMEEDRRRYEKWCKHHRGQCSKNIKMF